MSFIYPYLLHPNSYFELCEMNCSGYPGSSHVGQMDNAVIRYALT